MMMDAPPNVYAVWVSIVGVIGTLGTQVITYFLTKKRDDKQAVKVATTATAAANAADAAATAVVVTEQGNASHNAKLGHIEGLVNGRLSALMESNAALVKRVAQLEAQQAKPKAKK